MDNLEYKKKCRKCRYSRLFSHAHVGIKSLSNIMCGYILVTGKKRPCPADKCTVFEPKTDERQKIPPIFPIKKDG